MPSFSCESPARWRASLSRRASTDIFVGQRNKDEDGPGPDSTTYYRFGRIGVTIRLAIMNDRKLHDAPPADLASPRMPIDDLSAQSRAAGIMLVIFAGIMALAMVLKRDAGALCGLTQGVVSVIVDWRTWAVVALLALIAGLAAVLLARRS